VTPAYRDEILGLFNAKWAAGAAPLNANVVPLVCWPGVEGTPSPDAPWARIGIKENLAPQRTLGTPGNRRFERIGLVMVQVFAPISRGQGTQLVDQLCEVTRSAFEGVGTSSGLWFSNCRVNDIGLDKSWYNKNVVSEFRFQELH